MMIYEVGNVIHYHLDVLTYFRRQKILCTEPNVNFVPT